jgi:phosphatidate cytidylyltransferase
MFMQRLFTTLILVPLVLLALYLSNYWFFAAIILLLFAACGFEWMQLIPVKQLNIKIAYLLMLFLTICIIHLIYSDWLVAGLVVWFLIFLALIQFPKSQSIWGYPWIISLLALLLLPLFAQSLMNLFELPQGKSLILYLLLLVWGADIGAYLAGKQWGHHKLIPAVSPGKTIEGVIGGLVLSMLISVAGFYYFHPIVIARWYLIALLIALISLLGDLLISMLKRRTHIKDTGTLLPGHGGILDRLDSLIAAAPLFYCCLYFLPPGI